jgi:hypothetical protein
LHKGRLTFHHKSHRLAYEQPGRVLPAHFGL